MLPHANGDVRSVLADAHHFDPVARADRGPGETSNSCRVEKSTAGAARDAFASAK